MAKQLIFDEEARRALKDGVDALADALKVTLGPRGRKVIRALVSVPGQEALIPQDLANLVVWDLGDAAPNQGRTYPLKISYNTRDGLAYRTLCEIRATGGNGWNVDTVFVKTERYEP